MEATVYYLSEFCETNILGILSEALTADIEPVFADETGDVSADAAVVRLRIPELVFGTIGGNLFRSCVGVRTRR
jgi:hypothetical protein